MRIQRLELLRYGCFTDLPLELPLQAPDLHIVFGLNEAGKSTVLAAIEDFLFGIPRLSPYSFLHENPSLRIGGVLQADGQELTARRRKGNKDTLLTLDGVPFPIGESALAPFLGGADRGFYRRMFCLDHVRLREGGDEILQARDEVGQMLFAAGSGLAGVRGQLTALNEEADGLWSSRRAGHRRYYQAEERLKTATTALREHTVRARAWEELRRGLDQRSQEYARIEKEVEQRTAEARKLGRIRRVHQEVQRHTELTGQIAALGPVVVLPEDAGETWATAERDEAALAARIQTLAEQLTAARQEREALVCDEELLRRAAEIRELNERRSQVLAARRDLPERRVELAGVEAELRLLAGQLGWDAVDAETIAQRISPRGQVARVRTLLTARGAAQTGVTKAQEALEEARAAATEAKERLDASPDPADVSRLAAVLQATREQGDLAARIEGAAADATEEAAAAQGHLARLRPSVGDAAVLAIVAAPPREAVQHHRDVARELEQRRRACLERCRTAERTLERHRRERERIEQVERAVPPETLAEAREQRDAGWSLVRQHFVDGQPVPADQATEFLGEGVAVDRLPDAYEAAVSRADGLADQRFEHASAAADLAAMDRQIAEQEELLIEAGMEAQGLRDEQEELSAAWAALWTGVPCEPLDPDAMLEWLAGRSEALAALDRRAAAERRLSELRRIEGEARQRVLAEVDAVSAAAAQGRPGRAPEPTRSADLPLGAVLERAAALQRQHERSAQVRAQIEDGLRKATTEVGRRQTALEKAKEAWSEWERQWTVAVADIGLDGSRPGIVSTQADTLDTMREAASKARGLRYERIGKMEAFIAALDEDVNRTLSAVAPDLLDSSSEEGVLALGRRVAEATQVRAQQQSQDRAIAGLEAGIREAEASRLQVQGTMRHLVDLAGAGDLAALKAAIERSDSFRGLKEELARTKETLAAQGDGLSIAELESECRDAHLDQLRAHEETVERELKELRDRSMDAREARTQARQAFEQVGGDDAAALAEADRQAALTEMSHTAAQYCRVRTAWLLLQWAVDRYRRQMQAPLLTRASRLFAGLTNSSFAGLELEYDEQDAPHLAGARADGTRVGVDGMSTGTRDQLYLALRIASVEEYLGRAPQLPFVADDLFINFDDLRAQAGLAILAELATRTQVIFLTHHRHLVELAEGTVPGVSVMRLTQGAQEPPAGGHPGGRGLAE